MNAPMSSPCFTSPSGILDLRGSVSILSRSTCQNASSVTMKSKKKSRRRKESTGPSESPGSAKSPARINVDSGTMSLRQQLKALRPQNGVHSSSFGERTRYRKQKPDAEVYAARRAARDDDAAIPEGKYALHVRPLCYIDGYNVIGDSERLQREGDLESARRLLISDVVEFSHMRGWDCIVVFDAYNRKERTSVSVETTPDGAVDVVFTGTSTADTFIERAIYTEVERAKRPIWAVTNDRVLGSFSEGKGAHRIPCAHFIREIKLAKRDTFTRARAKALDEQPRSTMLQSSVDSKTRDALYKLRAALDNQ